MDNSAIRQARLHQALKGGIAEIPPAPAAAVKLLQLTRDETTRVGTLARVIETEPALAAKVLRVVNSAYYGFAHRINSINRAVTLLGFSAVRQIALQLLFFDRLLSRQGGKLFDRIFFWQHCLFVAVLSRKIAEQLDHTDPDALYAAGLLHDLGKILLETHGHLSYSDFLSLPQADGSSPIDGERNFFGIGHDQLGALISEHWGLPPLLRQVQACHHDATLLTKIPDEQATDVAIVSLADFTAWTQGIGSTPGYSGPGLPPVVTDRVDPANIDFPALLAQTDEEMQQIGAFYKLKFPNQLELRANLISTAIDLSQVGAGRHTSYRTSLTAPHQSLNPDDFIPATLKAIHREFGIDRICMLTTLAKKRSFSLTTFWPEHAFPTLHKNDAINIADLPRSLIEHLRSRRPMTISGEQSLLKHFAVERAAVVPVMSNRRLVGLLWLDGFNNDEPTPRTLEDVLNVCNELGTALANSRVYQEEKHKAQIDALTGLHNRSAIDHHLRRAFARAAKQGEKLVVGLIDIDHFKCFNDNFGHQAGDNVLRIVAQTLNGLTRPGDFLGRYGGEEFLFALSATDQQGAESYTERMRTEIERRGHLLSKRFTGHHLTVSIGHALFDGNFDSPESLINAADIAMYEAKNAGRNRIRAYRIPATKEPAA